MTPEFNRNLPINLKFRSLRPARLLAGAVGALLLFAAAAPVALAQTPTMIELRAMPVKGKKGDTFKPLPPITRSDIKEIKLGNKPVEITAFDPLLKGPHVLQIMILLDSMQMIGGNGQFDSIKKFIGDMPPNVEVGLGYMLRSKAVIAQTFTTDRTLPGAAMKQKTREQAANPQNDNGNPYMCLRDLAAHWPSGDPSKLRAVLMFTDGIIRGNGQPQGGDQLNPDVDGASLILQRGGIVPYPFFYLDFPVVDSNRSEGGQLEGQERFTQLTADTGGEGLWEGQFSPGSFDDLLNKLYSVLQSEVVVTVTAPAKPGKQMRLDVSSTRDDIKINGADQITVGNVLLK